jgi:hypothetical protein
MKMESKLVLALLSTVLVLPAQGFAGESGAATKQVAAGQKVAYSPANCPRAKARSSVAADKRRQVVADRVAKGELQGSEATVKYNPKAAKAHGKQK